MGKNKDTKPTTHYELANVSFKVGNYKDAIKKLDLALAENPKDYLSLFLKAKCYSKQISNNPNNCYEAEKLYLEAINYLDKAKVSEIKEREIKRDITIEYANSYIELVNNNRKVYNASFKKEPSNVNSSAWDQWCDENDILEENFISSLKNGVNAFKTGSEVLDKFSDSASVTASNHFREYSLNYIEDLLAYNQGSEELTQQWYDLLIDLRIAKQDNSAFSEKLANPLTLDRCFEKDNKDIEVWKKDTKKALKEALNRYCSRKGVPISSQLKDYAGIDLPLEAREKVKTEQEIIDDSIDEITSQKKATKLNMVSAVIAGICLFFAYLCFTSKVYRSAILCVVAAATAFPFLYKSMNNQRLAKMLRILTPILICLFALLT